MSRLFRLTQEQHRRLVGFLRWNVNFGRDSLFRIKIAYLLDEWSK